MTFPVREDGVASDRCLSPLKEIRRARKQTTDTPAPLETQTHWKLIFWHYSTWWKFLMDFFLLCTWRKIKLYSSEGCKKCRCCFQATFSHSFSVGSFRLSRCLHEHKESAAGGRSTCLRASFFICCVGLLRSAAFSWGHSYLFIPAAGSWFCNACQ